MSLILSIDTSLELGAICLSSGAELLAQEENASQLGHAGWIHTAIGGMLTSKEVTLQQLSAIAVCSGPGSYTGLRVAMATAKGLCYALDIPLITETTLKLTAIRARAVSQISAYPLPVLYRPMIDARRMEVFTALFDDSLRSLSAPSAVVLNDHSFSYELDNHTVVFCGNGAEKWAKIVSHGNAAIVPDPHRIEDLARVAAEKLSAGDFADIAYSEPEYTKNAYTGR